MISFTNPNRTPSNTSTHLPEFLEVAEAYLSAYGEVINGRTGALKECFNVNISLWGDDISHLYEYIRIGGKNRDFQRYSQLLLEAQPIPAFNAPGHPAYAKGIKRLPRLISLLKEQPASRQAVVVLSDETCFTSYQILIRDNKLQLLLSARSVHLTKGLPFDVLFWHEQIFQPAVEALGVSPGGIHLNIGSLQLEQSTGGTPSLLRPQCLTNTNPSML